jgi:hypothetical protein
MLDLSPAKERHSWPHIDIRAVGRYPSGGLVTKVTKFPNIDIDLWFQHDPLP